MFRLVVGMLAAFVGFSFGHSIPKWMESNKSKSAAESQSPSCAHPVRKLLLRRKSLRKFKFGSQRPGKETLEVDQSLQQLSKDIAEDSNGPLKCSANSSLRTSTPNSSLCAGARVRVEHKKLKFGSQKQWKEKVNNVSPLKGLDSNPNLPLSAVNVKNGSRPRQNVSANFENGRYPLHDASANTGTGHRSLQKMCEKSRIWHQDLHVDDGLPAKSKLEEPVFCKISLTQSTCESPVQEKSQMKQWKMKLMSLRSKAMASEKVWYEKFEKNEKQGRNLPVPSSSKGTVKKQVRGKENESPQWASGAKRRDVFWWRSSTHKAGLLVEGPISTFER